MSGYLSSFVTIHFIIFHRSTLLHEEKNTSSYVDSSYLFFFFFRTRRIQTDPWSGKHWQSSHVHVDHSIHGREIGKVCELPRTPKVSLRIFFESLVIGAGRVHTELISCARMRHRSYARSIWSAPKRRQSVLETTPNNADKL